MRPLKEVIKELRQKHGNKSQVAKEIGISSQLLGQYEAGRHEPKVDFFEKWIEVYNEDIRTIQKQPKSEANVSHETKNGTQVHKRSDNKENAGKDTGQIYQELYEKFLGDNSEYLVIHRDVLKDHRLIPVDRLAEDKTRLANDQTLLEQRNREIEQRSNEIQALTAAIREIAARPINIQLPDVKRTQE